MSLCVFCIGVLDCIFLPLCAFAVSLFFGFCKNNNLATENPLLQKQL